MKALWKRNFAVRWGTEISKTSHMKLAGAAHIILTVSDYERARKFYGPLCEFMGLTKYIDADEILYYVGGKTALGIEPCAEQYRNEKFVQNRVGLHHVCFRARSREDVDALHTFLAEKGATIVHPPEEGPWAPGYYSILFEDPDGIRLEVNHVPGKGIFDTPRFETP